MSRGRLDHVIAELRQSADENRRELKQLLEVRNRDFVLMNRMLDLYIEYQNAADLIEQGINDERAS